MTDKLSTAEISDWLAENPDFLSRHPQLLQVLKIPHATQGTSLIEYQVSVLQDEVRELKRKLQQYHDTAAQNEDLLSRIHLIQMEMMQAESLNELLDVVNLALKREFGCRRIALALFDADGLPAHEILVPLVHEDEQAVFRDLASASEPVCGRLRSQRLALLFGDAASTVQSAAVATLDRQVPLGLLAMGSEDEHQFQPGMGTLFLSLLAQTLGQCLAQQLPERRQQQA